MVRSDDECFFKRITGQFRKRLKSCCKREGMRHQEAKEKQRREVANLSKGNFLSFSDHVNIQSLYSVLGWSTSVITALSLLGYDDTNKHCTPGFFWGLSAILCTLVGQSMCLIGFWLGTSTFKELSLSYSCVFLAGSIWSLSSEKVNLQPRPRLSLGARLYFALLGWYCAVLGWFVCFSLELKPNNLSLIKPENLSLGKPLIQPVFHSLLQIWGSAVCLSSAGSSCHPMAWFVLRSRSAVRPYTNRWVPECVQRNLPQVDSSQGAGVSQRWSRGMKLSCKGFEYLCKLGCFFLLNTFTKLSKFIFLLFHNRALTVDWWEF